jgi:hypothetical protein
MTKHKVEAAAGMESLQAFVGKWHTEGNQHGGPLGPQASFVAVETFEWLEGGHFLVHRLEGRFGEQPAACVEIIGRSGDGLSASTFYNDGKTGTWKLSETGGTWTMTGESPQRSGGPPLKLRCTATFEDLGNSLVGKWEQSSDGERWEAFLETRSTKAQELPNMSVGG